MARKATPQPRTWKAQVVEHKMPSWVSGVIAISGILVTLWLRSGASAEQKGAAAADLTHLQNTVNEIKEMIRQENDKHEYLSKDVNELKTEVAVLKSKVP